MDPRKVGNGGRKVSNDKARVIKEGNTRSSENSWMLPTACATERERTVGIVNGKEAPRSSFISGSELPILMEDSDKCSNDVSLGRY